MAKVLFQSISDDVFDAIAKALRMPEDGKVPAYVMSLKKDDVDNLLKQSGMFGLAPVIWKGIQARQSGAAAPPPPAGVPCKPNECAFKVGQVHSASVKCTACGDEKKSGRKMMFCQKCPNAVCDACHRDTGGSTVGGSMVSTSSTVAPKRSTAPKGPQPRPADGLEQQVEEWIETLTNCPRGDKSFLDWLKDGKILCRMANVIKPGVIPKWNENCSTVWKERENVTAFIQATKKLGLLEKDCFSTLDLQEGKDWKTVNTSMLSLGAASMKVPGFKGPYIGVACNVEIEDKAREKQTLTQTGGLRADVGAELRDQFVLVNHM